MRISHAEWPLQVDELCHALVVELGSADFNADNVPSMPTLVSCCQGLITVDKEASTVRLIHFSLHEYLSSHPDIVDRPHSAVAEICLTYLNSRQIRAFSTAPSPDMENTCFLQYCSVYWGVHAKRELSDCPRSLALKLLLKEHYDLISTILLLGHARLDLGDRDNCPPFSGLHCASFFGIVEVVATLIEAGCYDINKQGFWGCTPLSWAAYNGHEEVVEILLRWRKVNPDKADDDGQTPLFFAARNGHEGVVKMLRGRKEVNPGKPDNFGQTPLSIAAESGHEGLVEIVLGREEVHPDKPDNTGRAALSHSALKGHEGVVKILLGWGGVNPDRPDKFGRTLLLYDSWNPIVVRV